MEADGSFWVTDQEGHWNPKNRINHVRPGGFYGNMYGYHDVTDESDAAMDPPACLDHQRLRPLPGGVAAGAEARPGRRSTAGCWSSPTVRGGCILCSPSRSVSGQGAGGGVQGGMVALPIPDLPTGIMRGRFNPADGQLYACGLYAWAGNRQHPGGFFRVRRTEQPLTIPVGLHAEPGQARPRVCRAARRGRGR